MGDRTEKASHRDLSSLRNDTVLDSIIYARLSGSRWPSGVRLAIRMSTTRAQTRPTTDHAFLPHP